MMYTLTTQTAHGADTGEVSRLLTPDGERVADPVLDLWAADLDVQTLRTLYRDMAITRRIDAEGVALQRQGQLGLWAPAQGQEAIQAASARACRDDDFLFPSYRELGVLVVRGARPADLVLGWRGEVHGTFDPYALNVATPQIIIGAQALHATGYAMGIQRDGTDQVAVAYFGDGATSQGDVNEAMVFASSFGAPVVFVCSNNQWAISEPVTVQSHFPIAGRAPGFGIPSIRVDGNDAIACAAAMRWALDQARSGRGPAFIEAVTYRMGPHTTSDDPTRYRDKDEVELWRGRDPLTRLEAHLRHLGAFDDAFATEVAAAGDAFAAGMREAALTARTRPAIEVLDDVYAEPHSGIDRQRERFAAYLSGFDGEEAAR
ncbi:MAG: pyruvate dehydrogenase (acetyl-transferring) E1 component subunit alpha [Microbacterium sp. SCN 70-200]|uniref:pyruvate dehydrogenase (acetyl-transferring) E1 component subunit alpha n=1 Tax=unclassified Microbacterium TaxID=2609290 RepID=UPI00086E2028|nr:MULTISPECIES: pyruvate dehydrogenase (acetyl-transferring) E1 component subunit alpha [unclassified Microbacterium]MBN9214357.1 pyruvate dehydrogenase (acetyl-transferring) E1 component subunit alpha [Microbacterium sp.]ODT41046.1 MAG: pyruvate dehydrogenase (acetyl-transferring) E1 component subunit alpha [Microbacterium sp. SCN 70-200]OJV84162.1 MAG: pyruvate dehydrogenase (acetyl-transferring) E1 component subunit alpha [Microbacterium sp. 70-16]